MFVFFFNEFAWRISGKVLPVFEGKHLAQSPRLLSAKHTLQNSFEGRQQFANEA